MLCRIRIRYFVVQTQHVLVDHADYTAPTRQDELGHTDQESICPSGKDLL